MRKSTFRFGCLFILLFLVTALCSIGNEKIYLFTDQNSCVSGDTIWFNVLLFDESSPVESNIVHVSLSANLKPINHAIIKCTNNMGMGYLYIPDSLSTGVYQVVAYSNKQKYFDVPSSVEKSILVYNRFESNLETIQVPDFSLQDKIEIKKTSFGIQLPKEIYASREKVQVALNVPENIRENLKGLFINARLSDPLTGSFPVMNKLQNIQKNTSEIIIEKDGMLVEGSVYDPETDKPAIGVLVLLTIPDSIPYFDYCVTNANGEFKFYLKNAVGSANMVFQVISKQDKIYQLKFGTDNLFSKKDYVYFDKTLTYDELLYSKKVIDAAFYQKMFAQASIEKEEHFEMGKEFKYPYYGKPDKIVYPELFIDLPDFTEISRELLPGVFNRNKDGIYSIRMLDAVRMDVFNTEPLKLINGIPVFDAKLLKDLGTDQIQRVEMVFKQKFYGDLAFNGVLSVFTKDESLDWTENIPNFFKVKYNCIQKAEEKRNLPSKEQDQNLPDFRKVFLSDFNSDLDKPMGISFTTSDLLGDMLIEVIGIGKDNRLYYDIKKARIE